MKEITKIAIVGAGLMGHGIAQAFAQRGYLIILCDISQTILDRALSNIRSNLETFVEAGIEAEENIEKTLSRINTTMNLREAVIEAQLVIEAVPEDLNLKIDLFEEIDGYCSEDTILTSNTSTIPVYEFGKKVKKKERLLITHWFNPPHIIPVVEIVPGELTSDQVIEKTTDLLCKIGKKPIKILKEIPGFLINRIQTAMFREILYLLEQQVVSPEDIDIGIRESIGLRLAVIGPLQTMDMGGLDLIYKGMKILYPLINRSSEVQKILKEKVERNELGLRTGKGFFRYEAKDESTKNVYTKKRDIKLLHLKKILLD